jgi:hypothetical protein
MDEQDCELSNLPFYYLSDTEFNALIWSYAKGEHHSTQIQGYFQAL